jgi:hypothetical protein
VLLIAAPPALMPAPLPFEVPASGRRLPGHHLSKPRASPPSAPASCKRSRTPPSTQRSSASTPRQFDEGGNLSPNYDTPPVGIDTGISPRKGRQLPPLRGGPALSPTPGQGHAGPRSPGARRAPPTCDPFGKAPLTKKGPISILIDDDTIFFRSSLY